MKYSATRSIVPILTSLAIRDAYRAGSNYLKNMVFKRRYYIRPSRIGRRRYGRRYSFRRYRPRYRRRRYSTAKRARLNHVGFSPNYGTCKRALTVNVAQQLLSTRTLYSRDLTWIDRASSNEINERWREMINVRGFKMCMSVSGFSTGTLLNDNKPLCLHMAILAMRNNVGNTPAQQQVNPVQIQDFFRGNGTSRAINFQNTLSGQEFNCLAINADAYVILWRKKYILGRIADPAQCSRGHNMPATRFIKKYIKLNRQVRYDETTIDAASEGRIFLVYWLEQSQGAISGSGAIASSAGIDMHIVTFFREPKC